MAIENPNVFHEVLSKDDFDEEIAVHGVPVVLRQGIKCPCSTEESGQPDASCSVCTGWGFLWDAGATVMAFGPNRRINRAYYEQGSIDLMDALWSFPTGTPMSHYDRFSVPTEIVSVSELLTKGAVNPLTGNTQERTRFDKILFVERAIWTKRTPSSGHPYTYVLTELLAGTDFEIINNNQVSWLNGGNAPDEGARYSIRFKTEAEYICWAPMRSRAENLQPLPLQWLAKRLDFIRAVQ